MHFWEWLLKNIQKLIFHVANGWVGGGCQIHTKHIKLAVWYIFGHDLVTQEIKVEKEEAGVENSPGRQGRIRTSMHCSAVHYL